MSLEADDNEALLVAWLSELLYLREVHGEAYGHFQVNFPSPGRLQGVAEGGPWREFGRPVKAVTFHGMRIQQTARGFVVKIVFDV